MQTYDEMVDSGVDWIGDIPKGWSTARIGSLFKQRNEKVSDKDFEALSVTKKGVVPQLDDAAKTNDGDNRKLVRKGDYVINSRSDRKGSSGLSALDGSVSLINTVLAEGKLESRYTHHLLRSLPFQEEFYRCGQGIVADLWSTNYQRMKNIHLPVPGSVEQQKIADFLDQETAKIDNLIAKQERLLELLEEKRRATITHAVTRGLDPHVELKETNIPWLGQIPAQWKVTKVGFETKFESGGYPLPKNSSEPKTLPWILIGDMRSEFVEGSAGISEKDVQELRLRQTKKGELLFSFKMSIGKVAIANHDMYTTSEIATFYDMRSVSVDYSFYMFPVFIPRNAKKNMMGSDLMNLQLIRQATIVLPPKDEQRKIAEYLKSENLKINELKQKIQTQIKLLKERRTSLISHAVTGKVRI